MENTSDAARPQGFFGVDYDVWTKVCRLGLTEALAYVILACGTDGKNRSTAWSVKAIGTYAGISPREASRAIQVLLQHRLITRTGERDHPQYQLLSAAEVNPSFSDLTPDYIWLPNSIVTGAARETPPIRRLRETRDIKILELFVWLYVAQNLRDGGGIDREVVVAPYDRLDMGQQGQWNLWAFINPQKQAGPDTGGAFFERFTVLDDLGLIQWVPHLFDAVDGEVLHPVGLGGTDDPEDQLGTLAQKAYFMLSTGKQPRYVLPDQAICVPVLRHIRQVALLGIARLRHRPHTMNAGQWRTGLAKQLIEWSPRYWEVIAKVDAGGIQSAAPDPFETTMRSIGL